MCLGSYYLLYEEFYHKKIARAKRAGRLSVRCRSKHLDEPLDGFLDVGFVVVGVGGVDGDVDATVVEGAFVSGDGGVATSEAVDHTADVGVVRGV